MGGKARSLMNFRGPLLKAAIDSGREVLRILARRQLRFCEILARDIFAFL